MTLPTTSKTARRVMNASFCFSALCVIPALASACQLERLFPEDVGGGAARLTVRNAAILTKLIDDDVGCGFDAPLIKNNPTIVGEVGQVGVVTWSIEGCVIDFGPLSSEESPADGHDVGDDCNGTRRRAFGKVTVSGKKIVEGVLTGDADKPVIPLRNDAAVIGYQADVEDFQITLSTANNSVVMQSGRLSLVSEIHLAQSASLGVCAINTSEVTMTSLTVRDAVYTLDTGDRIFDVEVPVLDATAQLGQWQDTENEIAGSITVWDVVVDLNTDHVLDPGYDRAEFQSAYTCAADMLLPQSYECQDISETVADGAARLLLNDVGNLVQAAVKDGRCGFASPGVTDNVRFTGEVGYDGGEAVYTIESPCQIDLADDTFLSRNCLGAQTTASGKATIRGTMIQRGRLTGDPSQPIIPTSRDAVEITFDVEFNGWSVKSIPASGEADGKTFIAQTGGVTGRMRPRLAKDSASGACSIATPVVTFDNVSIKPGTRGNVVKDGLQMGVTFQQGEFTAQVGDKDGVENRMNGGIVVDLLGQEGLAVDVSGDLDPAYDHDAGLAAYACLPNLVIPAADADCSFDSVIAENAARLTIQSTGTLASMINGNDDCGFEDTFGVLLFPTEVIGDNGEDGSMSWDVQSCVVDHDQLATFSEDCNGGVTYVEGGAEFVDVGRTVRGERDKKILDIVIDTIVPRERNAVDINLRTVRLTEFASYAIAAGNDAPAGILVIHDGILSGTVQPALGNRAGDTATYDVPTPVARLSSVRLSGTASLYAQGKTFHFTIDDAELLATNGSFLGAENALSGTISVNGKPRTLGNLALNPTYSPSTFDASYACTENLAGPVR